MGGETTPLAPCRGEPGRVDTEATRRIVAATRVNLNMHAAAHVMGLDPQPDFVNARTFALAACGAFQLVDHREPLPALFDAGEMVTFRSAAEMRALAEHYLDRAEDAVAIAARARERVLREHTCEHRVTELLRQALPPHLQPGATPAPQESLDDALARAAQAPRLDDEEIELRILADVREVVRAR
ncbi:MAG TPA: glycosyltransferase [Vicinamibacterales bacterium]